MQFQRVDSGSSAWSLAKEFKTLNRQSVEEKKGLVDEKNCGKIKAVIPDFLRELMITRSPSGYEFEVQQVIDRHMADIVDEYRKDTIGNRFATLKIGEGLPTLMLVGHMDELGFAVKYIDDKGFISFDAIGGQDRGILMGRRVRILTKHGDVFGVTGKKAVHILEKAEENTTTKLEDMWIDIGAKDEAEAKSMVSVGDPIVYDTAEPVLINQSCNATGRAFDDRVGVYIAMEVVRRLLKEKSQLHCNVTAVASTQEEVGMRGATVAAYSCAPSVGIVIDVGHATDFPGCNPKKFGKFGLGAGPIIARGVNINPPLFDRVLQCAEREKIPYQVKAETYPTYTDAYFIQMSRAGVPVGLISVPLRYMHTPVETINLDDVENVIRLICAFARSLTPNDHFEF